MYNKIKKSLFPIIVIIALSIVSINAVATIIDKEFNVESTK